MTARAFITGLSGPRLTPNERAFLRDAQPWGLIVFARNVETPEQLRRLTGEAREALGRNAPVLVDQEGGRVQRLSPPHWPSYPAGAVYGRLYRRDPERGSAAARLGARLIAHDLAAVGIDVDCLPVADVPVAGADPVIGDRAYGDTPDEVAALAAAVAEGLMEGGVLPVLKHLPGHGRAKSDSHIRLPVVETDRITLETTDFAAFRPLNGLPLGMTAHVVFSAYDPLAPATTSVTMIGQVIRGWIGFRGLLMSDDVGMQALSGTFAARTQAALAAGCDLVLHCSGRLEEMTEVAQEAPALAGEASRRAEAALAARKAPAPFDPQAARRAFAELVAPVQPATTGMLP
jgi:beta-N-acetylhexosaminidase